MPPFSLVIVAFGDPALVSDLLSSLAVHRDIAFVKEIVIVENGVQAGQPSKLGPLPSILIAPVRILRNPSLTYSSGVNLGVRATTSEVVVVSNNDIYWHPNESIAPLITTMHDATDAAIASPQMLFPDGEWQRSHGPFPSLSEGLRATVMWELVVNRIATCRFAQRRTAPGQIDYADGAFFAVRRYVFDLVGGFDESYSFYGEDVEFSWQARLRGYGRLFVPSARIRHVRGATSTPRQDPGYVARLLQSKIRFVARHYGSSHARIYRWLMRLHTLELAALSEVLALVRPSAYALRRRVHTRLAVRALDLLPHDVLDDGAV